MKIDVLDHGFVRLVESWGKGDAALIRGLEVEFDGHDGNVQEVEYDNETGIIEAARQSTQGSFRGWDRDKRLLKYLYENKHSTPFEFAGMTIEVKAPIFIFRQWHRHRTQSYNEASGRYCELATENYMPTLSRLMSGADKNNTSNNKQAGSVKDSEGLTELRAKDFQVLLKVQYEDFEYKYKQALDHGIPKELARIGMPVGRYSQMRATANLRNWLAFLTLRMDPHAQWEIRQFANAVAKVIEQEFPRTYSLFTENKDG